MNFVLQTAVRSVILVGIFFTCVSLGAQLERLGTSGGPFMTVGTVMLSAGIVGLIWGRFFPVRTLDYVWIFLPVPLVTLLIVAGFSGFTGADLLNEFNMVYTAQISGALGLPWAIGLCLGHVFWAR